MTIALMVAVRSSCYIIRSPVLEAGMGDPAAIEALLPFLFFGGSSRRDAQLQRDRAGSFGGLGMSIDGRISWPGSDMVRWSDPAGSLVGPNVNR